MIPAPPQAQVRNPEHPNDLPKGGLHASGAPPNGTLMRFRLDDEVLILEYFSVSIGTCRGSLILREYFKSR